MKPYGLRAEHRAYQQQYYGGYCNQVRERGLEPIPYHNFQQELDFTLTHDFTRRERMEYFIRITEEGKYE